MNRWTMPMAGVVGVCVLIIAQTLYVGVLLKIHFHEILRVMLLFSPGFAAFVTAYLAPRRKILMGLSLSIWGAVIAILSASLYELLGFHVDHIGGLFATFSVLLIYNAALCAVGGCAGYFLSKQKKGQAN